MFSSNCGMVGIGQVVGIDNVVDVAERLGIGAVGSLDAFGWPQIPSIPLGVVEVLPIDMAVVHATLTNGGLRNDPFFIERVENATGEVLYQHQADPTVAIDAKYACWTIEILEANVESGTGTRAAMADQPVAGKTGTTEGRGDAWFVGSTPYLATVIWMGHPEGNVVAMTNVGGLESVTGGSFPAAAFGAFNARYHDDLDRQDFAECEPRSRDGRFVQSPFIVDEQPELGTPYSCEDGSPDLPSCSDPLPDGAFSARSQTLDDGRTLTCPDSHPFGYDSNGDNIIDVCHNSDQFG